MLSPKEKIVADTFVALLCSQKSGSEKAKQEKILLDLFGVETLEFSTDFTNYFIWQLFFKSNGLDIVGCGATEFARLTERLTIKNPAMHAFECMLMAKESELKKHRVTFEEAFIEWFDALNSSSDVAITERKLKSILLTISQIDVDFLSLDVYLISRLKPWINRIFLLLEEKYTLTWSLEPIVSFGTRWMSELSFNLQEQSKINVIQSRIFTLFTDQSVLFSHARGAVKRAVLHFLNNPKSDEAEESLKEELLKLRRSINMFGTEGVADIGKFMEILLRPIADELAIIIITNNQTNYAILEIGNKFKQWNASLESTSCVDAQISLLDASTSLELLYSLLTKKIPLDYSTRYLHEKLNQQEAIISAELESLTKERHNYSLNRFLGTIDMYLRQMVSRIPLIDNTFLLYRHIFDENDGFKLLKKEYQYFGQLRSALSNLVPENQIQKNLKKKINQNIHEIMNILDEISLHLLTYVENEALPKSQRQCIQMIQDFLTLLDTVSKNDGLIILFNELKKLEEKILEARFATDLISIKDIITKFMYNCSEEMNNLYGLPIPIESFLESSILDEAKILLANLLSVIPNHEIPSRIRAFSEIEKGLIPYEKHLLFTDRQNSSSDEELSLSDNEDAIEHGYTTEEKSLHTSDEEIANAKAIEAKARGLFTDARNSDLSDISLRG